jgi:hypothetical protein
MEQELKEVKSELNLERLKNRKKDKEIDMLYVKIREK